MITTFILSQVCTGTCSRQDAGFWANFAHHQREKFCQQCGTRAVSTGSRPLDDKREGLVAMRKQSYDFASRRRNSKDMVTWNFLDLDVDRLGCDVDASNVAEDAILLSCSRYALFDRFVKISERVMSLACLCLLTLYAPMAIHAKVFKQYSYPPLRRTNSLGEQEGWEYR